MNAVLNRERVITVTCAKGEQLIYVGLSSLQSIAQCSVKINPPQPALTNKFGPWPHMTQPALPEKCCMYIFTAVPKLTFLVTCQ